MIRFIYKLDNEIVATGEGISTHSGKIVSKMLEESVCQDSITEALSKLSPIKEILAIESVGVVFNFNSITGEFDITYEAKPELAELIDALLEQ